MTDVVALGEVLIDFTQQSKDEDNYPCLQAHPGGAPANFLSPITKFGLKTSMIGKVGNDAFGHLLKNTLRQNKIDTKNLIVDDNYFTTLAFVTLDEKGDRSFSFSRKPGADTQIRFDEVNLKLIDDCKVFHFGTLSLTHNPAIQTTKKLVSYAISKKKLISFDPNLRKPLWDNLEDAKKAMIYGLSKADIVKISDEEVEFLFKVKIENAGEYLLKKFKNIKIVYVTCGAKGAYFNTRKESGFVPSLTKLKVKDTTGAGDIFGGSAMYKLLKTKKDIDSLTNKELNDIVKFACISAGLSTLKFGGISSVPNIEEINKYMK